MSRILACYSSKGGVGKTSTSVNLAYASAAAGKRTLLIDLDQQGASTFYFRVRAPKKHRAKALVSGQAKISSAIRETDYENLYILPAHQSYRNFDPLLEGIKCPQSRLAEFVDEASNGFQRIILDCPPTLSLVAENIFLAADHILVPVVPTTLSARTYEQLKHFFDKFDFKQKKLRPFFSMVERRKRIHLETIAQLRADEKRMLISEIPYSAKIEAMGTHREPVLSFAPSHPASAAYCKLWQEIESR